MTNAEFSNTSHAASSRVVMHSAHAAGSRGATHSSTQHRMTPWNTWVNVYGSNRCWELWALFVSPDQSAGTPHAHHHTRPSARSRPTVSSVIAAQASHGHDRR